MKILLCAVNSKYIHSNAAVRLLKAYTCLHSAREECPQIEIAEFTINNYQENVLAELYLKQPDVLLFSCYIWNWEFIRGLLPDLKKVLPNTRIWLGGPEVSFHAEDVLHRYPLLEGILVGEGEATFRDLAVECYGTRRKSPDQIAGLVLLKGSEVFFTPARKLLPMDEIPFIYREENIGEFEHRILYYESQRGCPFSCAYCLSSVDKRVRFRSLDKVFRELQFFLDRNVPQVKFVDRTFNISRTHSEGIFAYLAAHDNQRTNFHFEIAGDLLSERERQLLASMRPGQVQLEIGVQSVNPKTLQAVSRSCDLEKLEQNVAFLRQNHNIHIHLDLIAGLPFEDYATFAKSFNRVYSMQPEQLQLGFLKVLKGSPMETMAEPYQILYMDKPPYEVLATSWLSYDELIRLKKIEAVLELYYNSRQFTRTITVLERCFDSPFQLYESLALYYDTHGCFVQTPSRLYRYQILLSFALEQDPAGEELYRELLTFDLYFREHMKSRPAFAPDQNGSVHDVRQSAREKNTHIEAFHYPLHLCDAEKMVQRQDRPLLLLFDYDRRDPLDHNASVSVLT